MSDARWLERARAYIGVREFPGPKHNNIIVRWWEAIRAPFRDDETPWCAAFVGAVLEESGIRSTRLASARSYLKFGSKLPEACMGCIVVFWRGSPSGWSGHVGFVVGKDKAGNLMVLGGNQGDEVNIKPFGRNRVLGYRWPDDSVTPSSKLPVLRSDGKPSQNEA
ncbi:TIGR02594 family protein [Aminobacter aminovorans]|uniref:Uncharacterized protein (TIGR02594 family) n=1 Tax=Aminobacter aminovorans TaxID=83263 RepID=A0AAC9ARB0_AMIAI|nr:TIGR02594 family protein [Aminobacter aminovorans]AMS41146.1 hypothetical protein AA2016_2217 [Aminobacter aminovorans]MBB3705873.1 uncharacterized protein (TIGR02594 family) [Aminobacter aminovorans]